MQEVKHPIIHNPERVSRELGVVVQSLSHARLPWPWPTPGAYLNSCPYSQWCHPIISFSVVPFSSCLQSFPASGSFICHFFASGWSFSFSTSLSSEYSGLTSFRMDWLDLQGRLVAVQETLNSHLQHHSSKASMLVLSFLYNPTLKPTHDY